ncbi:MAG: DMT family transporter [Myxococcota bacterium]|jgi:drug/metabolite transporter (DMT)-like permease|nr:DMT family transporter [Myxococcota bacterium]
MEPWIPVTIVAAFLQNVRSALQKSLKGRLSNAGATYVRFLFGIVFVAAYLGGLMLYLDEPLPEMRSEFFYLGGIGGLAQVLGTAALLQAVSLRSFAVGTAFSKTEPLQAAAFGFILLGEPVGDMGLLALVISLVGVVILGLSRVAISMEAFSKLVFDRGVVMGIASGALFGIAAVCFRGASISLVTEGGVFLRAGFTLLAVIIFQALVMTIYLFYREPDEFMKVRSVWRPATLVGASGAFASVGWFTAMTMYNAAYVRAVGQLELVFALAASWFFFRERISPLELSGMAAVVGGVVLLVMQG